MLQRIIYRLQPTFKRNTNYFMSQYQRIGLRDHLFQRKNIFPIIIATGYGIYNPMVYALDNKKE